MNRENQIKFVCEEIQDLLIEKNRRYGDSALTPLRIFSQANTDEQLNVRIDDKLSRIKNMEDNDTEDAELDLIGYLILKRIMRMEKQSQAGLNWVRALNRKSCNTCANQGAGLNNEPCISCGAEFTKWRAIL